MPKASVLPGVEEVGPNFLLIEIFHVTIEYNFHFRKICSFFYP